MRSHGWRHISRPPGVTEALAAENRRAIHGYYADTGTKRRRCGLMARRHGLRVDPAWVSATPGVVRAGADLQAVSAPGDEVVVFPPAHLRSAGSFSPMIGAFSMRSWSRAMVATPWTSMRLARS
jgi:bifunctional pyridoxal-dependent enzyme with beta-cystathionase and maltose regulon repressor activities